MSLPLPERLDALADAAELAEGRLAPEAILQARSVIEQAGDRLRHGTDHTVVALAGSTGSGKSSLFNAIAGADLSETGVRRPTTSKAQACVWGDDSASELLDWLDVPTRHQQTLADDPLDGLVLLDLPDHDSTEVAHRLEVDRLVELVDVLGWVVDPQKYADAAIHDGYLKPMAMHREVMMVILNQLDRIAAPDRDSVLADLALRLEDDGLMPVPVIGVSAREGLGMDELEAELTRRVADRAAAVARLSADIDGAADRLGSPVDTGVQPITSRDRDRLIEALADAAGANIVADATASAFQRDSVAITGWPVTRWARRFRPDPLKRLHLKRSGGSAGRPTLPGPNAIQRARVDMAVRDIAEAAAGDLDDPWPMRARRAAAAEADLEDALARAVSATDLGLGRTPLSWRVGSALQYLLLASAIAGFGWLAALFVFAYFRLPEPPTPEIDGWFPWPTALVIIGIVGGLGLAAVFRLVARLGSGRRRRRAAKRIRANVAEVADEQVITPLEAELAVAGQITEALARARS